MPTTLSAALREHLSTLLTDYAETLDAIKKLNSNRFTARITVASDDDKEFADVGFARELAKRGLAAQKGSIEAALRNMGIEVS